MRNAKRSRTAIFGAALGLALIAGATGPALASGGGGSGGGGGSSACVAQLGSVSNLASYGWYLPFIAEIKTKYNVKNCSSSPQTLVARTTYLASDGTGDAQQCTFAMAANTSSTCSPWARSLRIQHVYTVTTQVLTPSGTVLASSTALVATPLVPNPNPPIGS